MDKKTVEHIANLARLSVTVDEAETYARQMTQILEHFNELSKVDTTGVEPLITASPIAIRPREDELRQGLGADALLENAPARIGNLFKVPNVA